MYYRGLRGERQAFDSHRLNAEMRALMGGSAWSFSTVSTVRSVLIFQWTRDLVGLLRSAAELDRLAEETPGIAPYRDLALAYAEVLRERPERAIEIYERVLFRSGERLAYWISEHGWYAEALLLAGRAEEAKRVCEEAIAQLAPEDVRFSFMTQAPRMQLALAEAALGNLELADRNLEELIQEGLHGDNPLLLGTLHQARARVALLSGDEASVSAHVSAMARCFNETGNDALRAQCERLLAEAGRRHMHVVLSDLPQPAGQTDAVTAAPRASGQPDDGPTVVVDVPTASSQQVTAVDAPEASGVVTNAFTRRHS